MKKNLKLLVCGFDYLIKQNILKSGQPKMKTLFSKNVFCIVLFCSLIPAQSQAQQVRIYNTENSGLPHNQVTSIAIDAQGTKWFGFFNGDIAKFDDTEWTIYKSSHNGSKGNTISSIAIDQNGNKWIGTSNSAFPDPNGVLIKFDNTTWAQFNSTNSDFPYSNINGIAIDELGNKWIGTQNGVYKFDDTNWTKYLPNLNIHAIKIDANGNKWFSATNVESSVFKFDDTSWTKFNASNSTLLPLDYYVSSIEIDNKGNKWFGIPQAWGGDAGGVATFDDTNWTYFDNTNSVLADGVMAIAIDKQENVWFGTSDSGNGGLVKFDGSNWTVYNNYISNFGFQSNWFFKIAIDDQGNKWIATYDSGVMVFNENGITTDLNDKLSDNSDDFTVYPNPAKDFISINGIQSGILEIINITGETINTSEVQAASAKINLSNLHDGIYTIRVTSNNKIITKKIIKN